LPGLSSGVAHPQALRARQRSTTTSSGDSFTYLAQDEPT
jgi:hypothetical protein